MSELLTLNHTEGVRLAVPTRKILSIFEKDKDITGIIFVGDQDKTVTMNVNLPYGRVYMLYLNALNDLEKSHLPKKSKSPE